MVSLRARIALKLYKKFLIKFTNSLVDSQTLDTFSLYDNNIVKELLSFNIFVRVLSASPKNNPVESGSYIFIIPFFYIAAYPTAMAPTN